MHHDFALASAVSLPLIHPTKYKLFNEIRSYLKHRDCYNVYYTDISTGEIFISSNSFLGLFFEKKNDWRPYV